MMCTPWRAGVDHDPCLRGDRLGRRHVRHHQVAVHVHAELARQPDVLHRDVGLGAVRRDPHQVGAQLARAAPAAASCRCPAGTSPRASRPLDHAAAPRSAARRRCARAHVLDGRGAEAVAVADADRVHAGRVEPAGDRSDLLAACSDARSRASRRGASSPAAGSAAAGASPSSLMLSRLVRVQLRDPDGGRGHDVEVPGVRRQVVAGALDLDEDRDAGRRRRAARSPGGSRARTRATRVHRIADGRRPRRPGRIPSISA